ncbi:hypothetical protein QVD17_31201 [Tagetes erecta]|uniref:DUF7804 domain-containing protein n=1 Tax=Tagetes erecta TaxID=13708 RepID=A0AAD8K9A9_TARER|nr:hypothetical protein QVD17_31201 [Tagetes erecta]
MASLPIRYGGSAAVAGDRLFNDHPVSRSNNLHSFSFPNLAVKSRFPIISTAATVSVSDRSVSRSDSIKAFFDTVPIEALIEEEEYDRSNDSVGVSEKIDEWMKTSVTEIVKNIKQAPLLVQIYNNGVVKTNTAVEAEDWPDVVNERTVSPDGIILVEELRENVDEYDECDGDDDGSNCKLFGVVIQGKVKGRDRSRSRSACYLLKTCSVNGGFGGFCTHFCLMKVSSFSKSACSQLNECWLLP